VKEEDPGREGAAPAKLEPAVEVSDAETEGFSMGRRWTVADPCLIL
jgi:hypothetical protein